MLKKNDQDTNVAKRNILKGQTFVITGTLESYSRKQIEHIIEDCGGKVVSSISSKTNYLVSGYKPGSKIKKATDLGIEILSENEFKSFISQYNLIANQTT